MSLWLDGWIALRDHGWAAFWILLVILWGSLVIRSLFERIFKDDLISADYFSLSMAGWILPVILLAISSFIFSLALGEFAAKLLSALLLLSSFFIIKIKRISTFDLFLVFSVLISLLVRFAFLRDLPLPAYFDSAEHYRLIKYFLESYQQQALALGLTENYYHLGFHMLSAGFAYFFHLNIADVMLAIGSVLLAILPLPLFVIVHRETNSISAALFASLISGFGFHMPEHLLNWGKYPALLSLVCNQFALGIAYLTFRNRSFKGYKLIFILFVFGILISVIVHSRTLIFYTLIFIAWTLTFLWKRLLTSYRWFGLILITLILMLEAYFIHANPALKPLLDGYFQRDGWTLLLILFSIIISTVFFREQIFFILTIVALLLLALFIPIKLPVYGNLTMLDRPYVQMIMYLPFSFLSGFGFASAQKWTQRLFQSSSLLQRFPALLLMSIVILNISLHYDFYPSPCCRFVTRDDMAALTWMDHELPADAKILIGSAGLYVISLESPQALTGVDAGIWIDPLISRTTLLAWQGIQFDTDESHQKLCTHKISYIYIGGTPQSFSEKPLTEHPNWYSPAFVLPKAKVYQVIDCD